MNNKGFIATSLIYSFFLVFVAVMASILATYAHNRILVSNLNEGIVEDLNLTVSEKYLVIRNILQNSDFENTNAWILSGSASLTNNDVSSDYKISYTGYDSIKIGTGSSSIKQWVTLSGKCYYVRYYLFRNGTIGGSSNLAIWDSRDSNIGSSNDVKVLDFGLNYVNGDLNANWVPFSTVVNFTGTASNYNYIFLSNNVSSPANWGFTRLHVDAMMLIDVTSLANAGYSNQEIKTYLDTLDYFEGPKSIAKP